jgi:hypothetical protein
MRWLGCSRALAIAAVTLFASVAMPAAARATTIDFGSPAIAPPGPGGPFVGGSSQPWDAEGIDFDEGYPQAVANPTPLLQVPGCTPELYSDPSNALSDSGGQALRDVCYDTEHFSSWSGWIATLHNSASQVSVDLLAYGTAGSTVELTAYNFSGDALGTSTTEIPSSGSRTLSVTSSSANIYFFSVEIPDRQNVTVGGFEVDDVSFNDPGTGTPEVLLESTGTEGYPGQTVTATLPIERFNGADNPVALSVSGLPSYVTNTSAPTIAGTSDSAALTFKIGATAPAPKLAPLTISATSTGVTIAPLSSSVNIGTAFLLYTYPEDQDVSLVAGAGAQSTAVELEFGGAPNPISLKASGLPTGVTASFSPNPVSGSNGSFKSVTVSLKAAGTAAPATDHPVTITATVTGSTTIPSQKVTIDVWVSTFVLRAQGMQVTQGTEPDFGSLRPSGLNESGGSYQGVPLVSDKKTVVRFFADAYGAPAGIPGVYAQLTAYRGSTDLGSIYNDYGPGTTSPGAALPDTGELDPAPVYDSELNANNNAFTFTLPRAWTYYNGAPVHLKLVAQVMPPWPDGNNTYTQDCSGPCPNSFVLNNVNFTVTGSLTVTPIELTANGKSPADFDTTFAYPSAVMPLADDGYTGFMWLPWAATIDISSIVDKYGSSPTPAQQNSINSAGLSLVQSWVSADGSPTNTMGISANEDTRGLTAVPGGGPCPASPECFNGAYDNPTAGGPSVVAYSTSSFGSNRPLSGVSHELFHQMGMLHAGPNCPNNPGAVNSGSEYWPPDQRGQLDGIALNTTTEPYVVIANGANGFSTAYDFMSYCAVVGGGDPDDWVSPVNWDAVFSEFELPPGPVPPARDLPARDGGTHVGAHPAAEVHGTRVTRLPRAAATIDGKRLHVIGFDTAAGLEVSWVGPQVGTAVPRGTSDYTLEALGATGNVLAKVAMVEAGGHFDQLGPFVELQGELPAKGVRSVEIISPTGATAVRTRPARAPHVRVLAPSSPAGAIARVGGRKRVLVRWRSTNPEHLAASALTASIDYSANGGKRWRTVWIGGDTGRASLSSFYFSGSKDAIVRVRVNDGFNEPAASSSKFTALPAPPQVSILSPAIGANAHLNGDAPVQLTGDAWTAKLQELGGSELRWYDGKTLLGTGSSLLVTTLPPGVNTIRLVAHSGHTAAVAVRKIDVSPVLLPFLHLQIPATVSSTTDSLTVTATSALDGTLAVAGQSLQLQPSLPSHVQVAIKPGTAPLVLELAVTADGMRVPFAVRVTR